jgi:hypothetical protein
MPSPQMNQHQNPAEENRTEVMEFVLSGFSDVSHLQWFLFGLFLAIYIIILLGNGTILLITKVESTLHTPMYYFLGNFFLFGNLLCVSYSPQNACESWHSKKKHLFTCLYYTNVLCSCTGSPRVFSFGCDVL